MVKGMKDGSPLQVLAWLREEDKKKTKERETEKGEFCEMPSYEFL